MGAPSLVDGSVVVTVSAQGEQVAPYGGFSLHLRWAPAAFSLAHATADGGLFDQQSGGDHGALCIGPTDLLDPDGGGFIMSCSFIGYHATTTAGVLVTVTLKPRTRTCSAIHIETMGPPDSGNSTTGSYLIDEARSEPEPSQYEDGHTNRSASACAPGAG